MNVKLILAIFVICIIASCIKHTNVEGVVYSKHNIPVPNTKINLAKYGMSSYPVSKTYNIAVTDNNGAYHFSFTANKTQKYFYRVQCDNDSGFCASEVTLGQSNKEDLHLN